MSNDPVKVELVFAHGSGRSIPVARINGDDYETIAFLQRDGLWDRLTFDDQVKVCAYIEGPLGRLVASLYDVSRAMDGCMQLGLDISVTRAQILPIVSEIVKRCV